MKAQTKNLLHWSSEISLGGEIRVKKKKKHRGFFSFKIAKSKLQNQNYTHETQTFTTVVNKFVIDAKRKVCLRH